MARKIPIGWAHAVVFALSVGLHFTVLSVTAHAQGVSSTQSGQSSAGVANSENLNPLGIRAGNIEIHPEVSARGGYDTNVFKADGSGDEPQSRIDAAGLLTVTPGITISTLGPLRGGYDPSAAPPKLQLKIAGFATFFQYLGLYDPVAKKDNNLRGAEFDVSGDFHILPKRPVSLVVGGSWARNARPFTASTGATKGSDWRKAQAFDVVVPRTRLMFESRGGILTAFTGYRPTIMHFEGPAFQFLSSVMHDVDAGIGWRFFPSTSLLYDMTFSYIDYYRFDKEVDQALATPSGDTSGISVLVSNSKRVRARAGINGAFTKSLSLRVLGGYAVALFDSPFLNDVEAPVGEAVLTYRFGMDSSLEGGYTRNLTPAAVGGYSLIDRGYAQLKFVFAKLFAVTAQGGVGYVQYGRQLRPVFGNGTNEVTGTQALGADGSEKRNDIRIDALLRAEYRVVSWLGLLADVMYQQNITDFDFGSATTPDPADYKAFQVNAGLRASY